MLLHGRLDVLHVGRRAGARRRLQDERARRRRDPEEIVDGGLPAAAARLRARVPPRRCRRGRGRRTTSSSGRTTGRRRCSRAPTCRRSRRSCRRRSRAIRAGDFRPTPSEFACAGCPALDLVCAGPRLRRARRGRRPPRGVAASVSSSRAESRRSTTSTATCRRSTRCSPRSSARASTSIVVRRRRRSRGRSAECLDAAPRSGRALRAGNATRDVARRWTTPTPSLVPRAARRMPARRGAWPRTVELDVDGLGRVLFCHGSPRADEEILTRDHARRGRRSRRSRASRPMSSSAATRTSSTTARVGGPRLVNAGSVGMPYEGRPGAYWALLGPDVELGATDYDVEAARRGARGASAIRAARRSASRSLRRAARRARRRPRTSRRRPWRVATSARRGAAVGPKRERIGPIIERLAAEHRGRGDRASLPDRRSSCSSR